MKAAVVGEKGVEYSDAAKPAPKANEILIKVRAASLNRADLAVASGHATARSAAPDHRGPGVCRRDRGGRRRGQGLQAGRSGHEFGGRRLRRYAVTDCGPRPQDPRQQHELRAGRLHAGGRADHAQRPGRRRPPQEGQVGADPGRQLRRRPAGHADRQADGRVDRHGHLDQRRPPRPAEGVRLRPGARHPRSEVARQGEGSDRRQGRRPDRRPGLGRRR